MYRPLLPLVNIAQARTARRLISRQFNIPIACLLAQFDIADGQNVASVFYNAEDHAIAHNRTRGPNDHDYIHDPYDRFDADAKTRDMQNKVGPFLRGYFCGKASKRY